MTTLRCPVCQREFESTGANVALPFCSERCRSVDLGRWLNEEHRLPVDSQDDEEYP